AAPAAAETETADFGTRVQEVVVTSANPAVKAAPVKANLTETEPQSIINRDAIEQFVPQTADYTQIANLTPSVTGGVGQNGPGLSESKSTLRGFTDGNYNITYDGIPWGDANGPTHHSTSFFPASTIGGVIVDRGPGKANDIGPATFGGSINLFSPEVSHTMGGSETLTGGSFSTWQSVTKLYTGDLKQLNDARVMVNLQELYTNGYLTLNKAQENNQMIRGIFPLLGDWQLTVFGAWNFIKINTNDNAGATLAQAAQFGKNYALNNDPASPNFVGYNVVDKHTFFHYAKLGGTVIPNVTFETQPYYYFYKNDTESTIDPTVTAADIAAGKGLGWTPAPGAKSIRNSTNNASLPYDIPGYIKLNEYHIYGDVTRLDWNFGMGDLRPGVWWEHATTHRLRYDYDATQSRFVADYRQKAGTGLGAGGNGILPTTPQNEEYDQNTGWTQYQPFVDLELRPIDRLTITPGVKWVNWQIGISTLANQKTRQPLNARKTFTKDLEFATINYKIKDNWSVYAQYATGILVPDISAFQVSGPTATATNGLTVLNGPDLSKLVPQTSTNYQIGTVFHGANWTADFDLYKIDFKNRLSTTTGPTPAPDGTPCASGEVCYYNQGGVTYQGFEGQVTYAVFPWLSVFGNGSYNDAKDNATHLQVNHAPRGTAGFGALYKKGPFTASIVDKYVAEQWAKDGQTVHINGYHQVDLSASYTFDRYKIEAQIQNITNSQAITDIKPGSSAPYDQYYWQAPVNAQVSLKIAF
ncbi:MAG: TonB-dependent receptor, partial [Caulobacteraceae bacterium]